jgi:uncharacterized RDD family membrane protein YckC
MSLQIATAQNVGLEYEIASVGERIAAQLIDYVVIIGWWLTLLALQALLISNLSSAAWAVGLLYGLPPLFYSLACEYFLEGQTVGKIALKIRVVRLDGGRATLSAYLLRWLFSIVDISLFSGLVAILTIIINGKGQRLGDLAAGTTVVRNYQTVKFSAIEIPELPEGYIPTYVNAGQLSDKDIRTIKKVMKQGNEELIESAADRVAKVLGVSYSELPYNFLVDVVNDHLYYSIREPD